METEKTSSYYKDLLNKIRVDIDVSMSTLPNGEEKEGLYELYKRLSNFREFAQTDPPPRFNKKLANQVVDIQDLTIKLAVPTIHENNQS